jgi:hypothetical protein
MPWHGLKGKLIVYTFEIFAQEVLLQHGRDALVAQRP